MASLIQTMACGNGAGHDGLIFILSSLDWARRQVLMEVNRIVQQWVVEISQSKVACDLGTNLNGHR